MVRDITPSAVVIENWSHKTYQRSQRVRLLLYELVADRGGARPWSIRAARLSRRRIMNALELLKSAFVRATKLHSRSIDVPNAALEVSLVAFSFTHTPRRNTQYDILWE